MTALCAIEGQLVDVRNVGTHKCVKLTVHVPAEYARKVIDAFGWATGVDPVPVAIARMKGGDTTSKDEITPAATHDTAPPWARKPVASEKRLAQQAGICCADPVFQAFLYEHDMAIEKTEECAVTAVYLICGVASRKDIVPGSAAATAWDGLYSKFMAWKLSA